MLKYYGLFRICTELDIKGKPAEFSFIPCRIVKGSNICRYSENVLSAYIPSVIVGRRLLMKYPDLFQKHLQGDKETILLFKEQDIEIVAMILKAKVKGRKVSPRSKRNIKLIQK